MKRKPFNTKRKTFDYKHVCIELHGLQNLGWVY